MDSIFGFLDPGALVGLFVTLLLFMCAGLLYRMRDPLPLPRYIARRLWCPHEKRKFTVEFSPQEGGAVHYCSAFVYGELPCDLACMNLGKAVDHGAPAG